MIKYFYQLNNIISINVKKKFFILLIIILINISLEIISLNLLFLILNYLINPEILQKHNFFSYIKSLFLDYNFANVLILAFIFFFILKTISTVILNLFETRISSQNMNELNNFFFQGYILLPNTFHQRSSISKLIKNLTIELQNIMSAINSLIFIIVELVVLISILIFLLFINFKITLVLFFILFTVSLFINFINSDRTIVMSKEFSTLNNLKHKLIVEGFSGSKEFNLIGESQKHLFEKFNLINQRLYKLYSIITYRYSLPKILFELSIMTSVCFFLIISFKLKIDFSSIVPLLGIFAVAAYRLIPSFAKISSNYQKFSFNIHSVEKLYRDKIIFESNKIDNKAVTQIVFNNIINVKDLSFTYSKNTKDDSNYLFKNLNFDIKRGDKIGIYGSSGIGKSTLLDLIIGVIDPTKGEITLDEKNIKTFKKSYQNIIGCVSQDIFILNDSLKKNIAFNFPDQLINIDRIKEVIKIANLDNFEKNLKFGLNTLLGDGGSRLSGGQRQRIGIARAIYSSPQILIFDEATNALDEESENEILNEIFYNLKNITIIIVSHNKKVVDFCDSVYELKNKKLVKI